MNEQISDCCMVRHRVARTRSHSSTEPLHYQHEHQYEVDDQKDPDVEEASIDLAMSCSRELGVHTSVLFMVAVSLLMSAPKGRGASGGSSSRTLDRTSVTAIP